MTSESMVKRLEIRIEELERRVKALEGKACPKCHAMQYRIDRQHTTETLSGVQVMIRAMHCSACGFRGEEQIQGANT